MTSLRPRNLNHAAYPTWDSQATYDFYTRVLGCELVAAVRAEQVPSTGDPAPFLHTFYALSSGECIAFFEIDELPPADDDGIPEWVRHIAFNVETAEDLDRWQERLRAEGIDYRGPVDHDGTWTSIYFFDPNGVRLELTHQSRQLDDGDRQAAVDELARWSAERSAVGSH